MTQHQEKTISISSRVRKIAAVLALSLLGACAQAPEQPQDKAGEEPTVVSFSDYRDPLIGVNRAIFAFNDVTFRYVLIPASKAYNWALPSPARTGIGNFFNNLAAPVRIVNHILQLRTSPAAINTARFVVNTTVGVLGLFDPAQAWFGMEPDSTGFEETLSRYGAGYGSYLVLPFFGPSDLRNGGARIVDYLLHPVPHTTDQPVTTAISAFDNFQQQAPGAERYLKLKREAEDPYLFFRNLYLQGVQRDAQFPEEPPEEPTEE